MAIDLSTFDTSKMADEGVWMELEHPDNGEPLDVHFKVLGKDSEKFKKQVRKNTNKRLKTGMKKMKAESLEAEDIELMVACTVDWKNVMDEGEELEFSNENIRKIYKKHVWIKEQVDEFIGERGNFLGE